MKVILYIIGAIIVVIGVPFLIIGWALFTKKSEKSKQPIDLIVSFKMDSGRFDKNTAHKIRAKSARFLAEIESEFGLQTLYKQRKM